MKESLDMIFKERKFDSSENLVDLHDSKVRIHRRKVFFFFQTSTWLCGRRMAMNLMNRNKMYKRHARNCGASKQNKAESTIPEIQYKTLKT